MEGDARARLAPEDPLPHREIARVLATCENPAVRDGKRAVEEATTACRLTKWSDPDSLDTLAAASAEAGDFDAAVKWQSLAIKMHQAKNSFIDGQLNWRSEVAMKERLALYKARMPYHEKPSRPGR